MAVKNGTTSTRPAKKVRIPASRRKYVAKFRAIMQVYNDQYVTNAQAYREILKGEKQNAEQLAKEQAQKIAAEKARKKEARESSIATLQRGIMNLADVNDLLKKIERGEHSGGFTTEALTTFARATLAEVGRNMEQALLDTGLLDRENYAGVFVDHMPEQMEAPAAA